jgi:hypothetical protein
MRVLTWTGIKTMALTLEEQKNQILEHVLTNQKEGSFEGE